MVKLGALGAVAVSGDQVERAPAAAAVTVVDPVGAGDAFAAGYLSEVVAGGPLAQRLYMGNTLGGAVCQVRGDWEGLPNRAELHRRPGTPDVLR